MTGLLIVTGVITAIAIILCFRDPLIDERNDSDSFFNLNIPRIYHFKHYTREVTPDGLGWKVNATLDKFQVVSRDGSRYWQQLRKSESSDVLISELKFGDDGRTLYATHLSFSSESDPRSCITTECYGVEPESYLWLPFIHGDLNYYKNIPQAVWKSSMTQTDIKGYPFGGSTPIVGQISPHVFQVWKFAGFGGSRPRGYLRWPWLLSRRPVPQAASGYFHTWIPTVDVVLLLVRRFMSCSADVVAIDEENWRFCGKFQDEWYAKDAGGNPLGLVLSVGGSIVTPESIDIPNAFPRRFDAYARDFYAQNYLEVEYISTPVAEEESWS